MLCRTAILGDPVTPDPWLIVIPGLPFLPDLLIIPDHWFRQIPSLPAGVVGMAVLPGASILPDPWLIQISRLKGRLAGLPFLSWVSPAHGSVITLPAPPRIYPSPYASANIAIAASPVQWVGQTRTTSSDFSSAMIASTWLAFLLAR